MDSNDRRNGFSSEDLYRMLPSVNDLIQVEDIRVLLHRRSHEAVVNAIRSILDGLREEIAAGIHTTSRLKQHLEALPISIADELSRAFPFSLRPVINATGVILHTNLGRAPLSKTALDHMVHVAGGYSNLELDLESGERGTRDVHVERLILGLIGSKAAVGNLTDTHRAIVVNNCAAATFLALHALASGKEVIVSRGELVEIGGGFRIPEILKASGALLKEVGTTNRTRLVDYEDAISTNTGLILRVHQSNFSMEGFVARPALAELVAVGGRAQVPVFEDQGTGLMDALEPYGVQGEATLIDSVASGCDLVAASGDKLLGGPQCGILVGRKDLVERIRRNPLFRVLRVDKLTYAALEATLADYLSDSPELIPTVRMLRAESHEIKTRCERIVSQLNEPGLDVDVVSVQSLIGGGAAPRATLQSYALSLRHSSLGANSLLLALRRLDPPVIGRISDDRVLLDLRTVDPESDAFLVRILNDRLLVEPIPVAAKER